MRCVGAPERREGARACVCASARVSVCGWRACAVCKLLLPSSEIPGASPIFRSPRRNSAAPHPHPRASGPRESGDQTGCCPRLRAVQMGSFKKTTGGGGGWQAPKREEPGLVSVHSEKLKPHTGDPGRGRGESPRLVLGFLGESPRRLDTRNTGDILLQGCLSPGVCLTKRTSPCGPRGTVRP